MAPACHLSTGEADTGELLGIQSQHALCSEFQASLGYHTETLSKISKKKQRIPGKAL